MKAKEYLDFNREPLTISELMEAYFEHRIAEMSKVEEPSDEEISEGFQEESAKKISGLDENTWYHAINWYKSQIRR